MCLIIFIIPMAVVCAIVGAIEDAITEKRRIAKCYRHRPHTFD